MADFSFVSNARFRPFSYQEMLQPLQAYTQEYNTIEESMGELASKADVFKQLANEQTDPIAHAMYKKYADDLSAQADSLAREGLTPTSRQGLLNMKRRYSSEIIPIEQAYQNRQKLAQWWRDMVAKDQSLMSDVDPSVMSLDTFLNNPNVTPKYYSGERLKSDVFQLAQQLAKNVEQDAPTWRGILGNQYYESIKRNGFKASEIFEAIKNSEKAPRILTDLVEGAVDSAGIKSWATDEQKAKYYDWARQGLLGAIGGMDSGTLANLDYKGRKGSGSDDTPPYSDWASTAVTTGTLVSDTPFKEINAKGFKPVRNRDGSISYTTDELDALEKKKAEAQRELDKLPADLSVYNRKDAVSKVGNKGLHDLATGMRRSMDDEFMGTRDKLNNEIKEYNTQISALKKSIQDVMDNYDLHEVSEHNFDLAQKLERAQSMEQKVVYNQPFRQEATDDMVTNIFNAYNSRNDDSNGAVDYTEGKPGKTLSVKKTREFLYDKDKPRNGLSIDTTADGLVVKNTKGEKILLTNILMYENIQERAKSAFNFLRNFKRIKAIDERTLNNLRTRKDLYEYARTKGEDLGNGLYGIHAKADDTVYNFIIEEDKGEYHMLASNAWDEINSRGTDRSSSMSYLLNRDFANTLPQLLGNQIRPSGLPSKALYRFQR